ncbi:MAG: tetratricopeptide repeat protein [Thermoanaerobaculia bacterium]
MTILAVTAGYLYAFPGPTLAYIAVVVLHAGLGVIAVVLLIPRLGAIRRRADWVLIAAGAGFGVVLLFIGTARVHRPWLYAHIALSLAGAALLSARAVRSLRLRPVVRVSVCIAVVTVLGACGWTLRETRWKKDNVIRNPASPPTTMDREGDGAAGPFFPSSAQTTHGGKIPAKYFMESDACQRCHGDIYDQWFASAHHFSSFNNQWYRASIEYMQDVVGVKPSKWCAGCHDPALLFSGMFDTPIRQIVDRPEAKAGLGCMMCHSIVQVKSTMGQGDFTLTYPKLHELAANNNPIVRRLHDYAIRLNPEPHRRAFLKPFMREQPAEFCSSCHKVHLDVPVNHYRWMRGFNEYDSWQASGVSGFGARSFYYPPKSSNCVDCHMPQVQSADHTAFRNQVRSHSFAAANSALPVANGDGAQLERVRKFLKDSVTVDVFAVSPAPPRHEESEAASSDMATTFGVGEEAEPQVRGTTARALTPLTAPLNGVAAPVRRGESVIVDVVVRTRTVGHFFPAGTVDAFDTWVELKATDDRGKVIFWSGRAADDGKGPVDRGAHFYRSLQIDAHGNPINKRNAWASRAVVYVRLIPPGAADTVHYRLDIPPDAGDTITVEARLCYRKFAWWNTQFSFAGTASGPRPTPHYDDRRFTFRGDRSIPNLPIVEISRGKATLSVTDQAAVPRIVLRAEDWTRWNDYGIGLLLQGDLAGARRAFEQITRIDSRNVDGWVNLGRVAVQEGDLTRARHVLENALRLQPELARANFFFARVLRAEGRYDEAIPRLRRVLAQYPSDRVVRNELARILFRQRKFGEAIRELQEVLRIDPEDLQAHYTLMLCYRGLGDAKQAAREKQLYERFKFDDSAQALTGAYRKLHPADNNERQAIHEHASSEGGG